MLKDGAIIYKSKKYLNNYSILLFCHSTRFNLLRRNIRNIKYEVPRSFHKSQRKVLKIISHSKNTISNAEEN